MTGGDLSRSLNDAQRRAVSSQAATVAILAGPGSGKTHTLTSRVVWLVEHVGYQPCDLLVATFTVKAAREMKERIARTLRGGREKGIILGTFHSIARRYLATYGQRIGLDQKFGIADDSDSRGIVTRICKRLDVQLDPPVARAWISKKKARGTLEQDVVKPHARKAVESRAYETCYAEYQEHLRRSNLLDYDDLLVRCVELLRKHPSCVSNIQAVLIDEYQDTNGIQYELMKLFAQQHQRITIVGDPDQSIYGWRSAEIRNLHRFLRDFSGTDEVSLEENYRSSSSILDVSLKVIREDKERYQKALVPVHTRGTLPVLRKLKNQMDEADWIISEIKRIKLMSGDMIEYDDVAILLRSASLSRHIESALGKAGIAYKMVGGFKFYERAEIKIILDYLRIIHQPDNNDALARIINVPKRGIGEPTIKALIEEAERDSMSLWTLLTKHCRGDRIAKTTIRKQTEQKISGELIKLIDGTQRRHRQGVNGTPVNLVELIERLLQDLKFEKFLEDTYGSDGYESRWANVQEFVNLAGEFMKDQSLVEEDALPEIDDVQQNIERDVLARFLANVSLASDKQANDKDQTGKPLVTVSTIHAAKGLEWPVVFIPAVYKGSIPHMRADDEAEERRLLYVAMTRAQALLYLSCPLYSSFGSGDALQLSPFIEDLSSTSFLKKGPSLERQNMLDVARILGRQLPTNDEIYKKMPLMSAVEDNLFPVDPNEPKHLENADGEASHEARRWKRQKTYHASSGTNKVAPESVEGWNAPYATTMQRSSSFTLPGFTTASAQHVVHMNEQQAVRPAPEAAGRKGVSNRPPAQRSLLGYMVKEHNTSKLESLEREPPHLPPHPQRFVPAARPTHSTLSRQRSRPQSQACPRPPAQDIAPELSQHNIRSTRLPGKPTAQRKQQDPNTPKKSYACFSSSPPQPQRSPEKQQQEEEETVPEKDKARPASCYHATTVNVPQGLRGQGFKRPPGLHRDGITPIERLRKPWKPFKPLTINRQGG